MATKDRLSASLKDVADLDQFLHAFIPAVADRRPRAGEDVTRYVQELGLKLPDALKGESISWAGHEPEESTGGAARIVTLAQPGNAGALGFTVKCVTIHGRRYCLECGWLYCRITTKI
jgi:hypothetical protein